MFKKSRFVFISVISLFISAISGYAQEETFTIVTYYPSPYGVYREMRAQRMAIGNTYINNSVLCWEPPCPFGSTDISDTFDFSGNPTRDIDLIVQGNVGIGTTGPIGNIGLHLKTPRWNYTWAAGMVIQGASVNDNPGLMLFNSTDKEIGAFGGATSSGQWSDEAQIGDITLKASNGRLIFSTSNVSVPPYPLPSLFPARMIIDQTGNVGIGTAGMVEKLNVNGNIFVNTSGGDAGIRIQNAGGSSFWVNSPTTALMAIGGTGGTPPISGAINITSGGNVGIGTTTPQTKAGQSGFLDAQDVWLRDAGAWASTGSGGGFGSWTNIDSSSNALVMNNVYRVTSDGFVIFRNNNSATVNQTIGYTDSSNPPTTERAVASEHSMDAIHSAMMPVKKNDYWRIATNFQPTYIYWLPIGSGQSVRQ